MEAPTDPELRRFVIELEFVQCLANFGYTAFSEAIVEGAGALGVADAHDILCPVPGVVTALMGEDWSVVKLQVTSGYRNVSRVAECELSATPEEGSSLKRFGTGGSAYSERRRRSISRATRNSARLRRLLPLHRHRLCRSQSPQECAKR